MASIYTYPEIGGLSNEDLFVVTDVSNGNSTKSVDLQTLSDYIGSGGGGGGTGTVTSVTGTGSVSGITLSGTVTASGQLTLGGSLVLTSGQITTGLGFTPYNATNPDSFTSFAEPAIFSGGGTPTLASGVTAEEIRTLIGAGSGGGTNLSSQLTSTTVRINSDTGNDVTIAGATGSIAGVMTAEDKTKLDDISIFKNFAVDGQTTVVADSINDTLTLVAGTNVTITTNDATNAITIDAANVTNTFDTDISVNQVLVGNGNTTAVGNTRVGKFSLGDEGGAVPPLSGADNTAVGFGALRYIGTGERNTSVGSGSANSFQISGNDNTSLGYNSLRKLGYGLQNVAVGSQALKELTGVTGSVISQNVAVGFRALPDLETGARNVAVGYNTGGTARNNLNDSVFIGDRAISQLDNQTNQIVIGATATGNGSNTVTLGNTNVTELHVGGNGAGLVLKSPNGTAYKITVSDAGAITATAV